MTMKSSTFEWDKTKNRENIDKHGVAFERAQHAFGDASRVIALDHKHSTRREKRYFCYGQLDDDIVTVRFTWRNGKIRIFVAGFRREGRYKYYEKNKCR